MSRFFVLHFRLFLCNKRFTYLLTYDHIATAACRARVLFLTSH